MQVLIIVFCIDIQNYYFRNQLVLDNNDEKCFLLQSKNNIVLFEKMFGLFLKGVEFESVVCLFLNEF